MRPAKKRPVFLGFFFFSLLVLFSLGIMGPGLTGEAKGPSTDEVAAAVNLYYQGDLEAAIAGYSRLLDRYPSSAEIRLDLIRLLREKGDMPKALEHLAALVEEYPEETSYRLELTIAAYLACEPGLALESFALLPETAETLYWRGLIYKDLRREADAIENLEKSLALQSYQPTAHYFLGELYFARGDYKNARSHFLQALKQEPNMTAAFPVGPNLFNAGGVRVRLQPCCGRKQASPGTRRSRKSAKNLKPPTRHWWRRAAGKNGNAWILRFSRKSNPPPGERRSRMSGSGWPKSSRRSM